MEPLSAISSTAVALIFGEAFKEGGKAIGKGASEGIQRLSQLIYDKFKSSEVAGFFDRAKAEPTKININRVEQELSYQIENDEAFAKRLDETLLKISREDPRIQQILLRKVRAKNLTLGDIEMRTNTVGNSCTEQAVIDDSQFEGDINFTGKIILETDIED